MKKDAGKKIIEQKIEDFEKNSAVLKKKGHGETNIRSNYIDVFFEALGWNMKSHYDVVREFSQVDTSGTKRVDYAFKVNGKLKFFVEAKEASIDLVNDKDAIYQAKRYAYSTNGKAPIVILTDFEEFRVFNVLKAPDYNNTDRELMKKYSFEYTGYLENWDILWDTFSKEAVTAGSLDALRGKIDKNTKTMDVDFLEQITGWRETLAKTVALRNKELTVDELNEAVQRILDRLLFIRNLEDREIEPENTLLDKTKKAENIYKSLIPLFNNLDNVYNGLLFKKHFSEELIIDDKTIKDIIKSMCYPVSPFQFDVIEPEILGRIYEKFLGSKIRLTENHQAKIEEKMEVRKAGGVYYTPEYIVNYIVENTVGKKIEGLNPVEIKNIKICDPACGSGSFLLGAYSYLLDYHEKWYAKNKSDKAYKKDYYITKDGELKVNLDKRGAILRDNIFGVDIDKEATEVAIMSLYLKMLDDGFDKGERDLFFIKGHVLPDMTENVKCGNSLIGTDYFDGKLEIDIEEMKEIKAFDWDTEFLTIFTMGGFDCVIGNPPYGADFNQYQQAYFHESFSIPNYQYDSYLFFIEKSIKLLQNDGLLGIIIPNTWLLNLTAKELRKYIFSNIQVVNIVRYSTPVFQDAVVDTEIIIFKNSDDLNCEIKIDIYNKSNELTSHFIKQMKLIESDGKPVNIFERNEYSSIKSKADSLPKLDILCKITQGTKPFQVGKGKPAQTQKIVDEKPYVSEKQNDDTFLPLLRGSMMNRYQTNWNNNYWIKFGDWLAEPRYSACYEMHKIIIRQTGDSLIATYDQDKFIVRDNLYTLVNNAENINLLYLLGLINSKFMNWFYQNIINNEKGEALAQVKRGHIANLPIVVSNDFHHDSLVTLVEQMLQTQNDFRYTRSESDKKLYEQKIGMLDKKIDDLVYKLYGLTDEEIRIVEGV